MAENKYNISGLNSKVENEGQTNQGKLSATEFNLLVNAAIESQEKIDEINNTVPLKKQITLTGQGNTVVSSGVITGIIPGHQYIVNILNPEASCSEITLASSSNRIYVSSIDENDKEMTNFKLIFSEFPKETSLPSYFYFVSNDTRISIKGVVNTGVELNLVLSDLGPVEAENFVDITDQVYTNSVSGYITINNVLKSSTSFYHSEPISLSKGDILKIYRCHNYSTTDVSIVSLVGDDNKYYSRVIVKKDDYSNSDGYEYYAIRDCNVVISFHFTTATNHRFIKVLKSSGNDLSNLYTDNKELNNYIEELYIPSFGSVHEVSDLDFYFSAQFPQDDGRYYIYLRDGNKVNSSDTTVSSYSSLCPQFSKIQRTAASNNSGISTYIKFKENVKTFSNYRCSFSDRVLDLNKSLQIKNFLEEDMQYSPISSGYPEYLQSLKAYATTVTKKLTAHSVYEYSLYKFYKGVTYCFRRNSYPEAATILAFKTTADNFKVDGEINKFDIIYHAYFGHSVYYTPKEDEDIAILTHGSAGVPPYIIYYPVEKIPSSKLASVSDISRKIYLNKTEKRYINTSTAKLGEVFSYSSMARDDNYSFKIFNVNPGEKYEFWIRGNTGTARTLLLDEEDKVINIICGEKKGFVMDIPDNGKTLIVNSVTVNNSFGDPHVIRTKNVQSYLKNIEDNLGFVEVKVGSNSTITDVKSVRTPFVPITSNIMGIKTNRPNKEGYMYKIGYSLTSSPQDIGSFETDANINGYIIRKMWNDTDENLYADVSLYSNAVGISFTIVEVDINNPNDDSKRNVLRPKDFDGYYISINNFYDRENQKRTDDLVNLTIKDKHLTPSDLELDKGYNNLSVGQTAPETSKTISGYGCVVVPVSSGDKVKISTKGGSYALAWYILDSNRVVLSLSDKSLDTTTVPKELEIEQSGYIISNCDLSKKDNFYIDIRSNAILSTLSYVTNVNKTLEGIKDLDKESISSPAKRISRQDKSVLSSTGSVLTISTSGYVVDTYLVEPKTKYFINYQTSKLGNDERAWGSSFTEDDDVIAVLGLLPTNTTGTESDKTKRVVYTTPENCTKIRLGFNIDKIDITSINKISADYSEYVEVSKRRNNRRMYNPAPNFKSSQIRILDIGNSFSKGSLTYVPDLVTAAGIDTSNLCIYHAMRSSGSFKTWYDCFYGSDSSSVSYTITKNLGGITQPAINHSATPGNNGEVFRQLLEENTWDIVIIHQVSGYAGDYDMWGSNGDGGYLKELLGLIRHYQPAATIGTHLTHASNRISEGDTYSEWYRISESIRKLRDDYSIDFIIPVGTAIENLRNSSLNTTSNNFSMDNHHLAAGAGLYVASCAYFQTVLSPIYNKSIYGNTFRYSVKESEKKQGFEDNFIDVTDDNAEKLQQCSIFAWNDMFNISDIDSISRFP